MTCSRRWGLRITEGHGDSDLVILGFQEFLDKDYGFAQLAKKALWKDLSENRQGAVNDELLGLAAAPVEVIGSRDDVEEHLEGADGRIAGAVAGFDASEVASALRPVRDWTDRTQRKVAEVLQRFPNLRWTDAGIRKSAAFTDGLRHVERAQKKIEAKIDIMRRLLTADGRGVAASRGSPRLWGKVDDTLAELQKDLDLSGDREKGGWSPSVGDEARGLLRRPALRVRPDDVDTPFHPVVFSSGYRCTAGSHYNTVMYAFVNPWSNWSVAAEPWFSDTCIADSSRGNERRVQHRQQQRHGVRQGRQSVQIQGLARRRKLPLLRPQHSHELCGRGCQQDALSGGCRGRGKESPVRFPRVRRRLQLAAALRGGRGHLAGRGARAGVRGRGQLAELPGPRAGPVQPWRRGLQAGRVTARGRGRAGAHACPRRGAMPGERTTEEPDNWLFNGKRVWERQAVQSRVRQSGLFEAPVGFAPTYKVGPRSKAEKSEFYRCGAGEGLCYHNPSGKGKHNPAWTDRMLLQADSSKAEVEVLEYSRRVVSEEFGSDHVPVVGRLHVRPVAWALGAKGRPLVAVAGDNVFISGCLAYL
ncbi:unnamed protein product [Prorocentrum cordatum]|uniref:Inositol polyphosphate-related phosphatase domain-containing protein n=1 Tax=Prorocentrum cordatum TaxID=2364126 RepID=A0ABN9YI73_9DINO|nr:unnamed protein product [Polarella glacialis]